MKLATEVTTRALNKAHNSVDFLEKMGDYLDNNKHRIYKSISKPQFQNSLLDKLLQLTSDEDLEILIEKHYKILIQKNEIERFSPLSRPAFTFLKRFTKYNYKDGKIVNFILDDNGLIISEPSLVNKHLTQTLKEIQTNPSYPSYERPIDFPNFQPSAQPNANRYLNKFRLGKPSHWI